MLMYVDEKTDKVHVSCFCVFSDTDGRPFPFFYAKLG